MASLNCNEAIYANEEEQLGMDEISSLMGSLSCNKAIYANEEKQLGIDEIWEISSRMPAKSAIMLLSLSKSLSTIPKDPLFVERQTIHSSRFDGGFFLQPYSNFKVEFHVPSRRDRDGFGIPRKSLAFLQQQNHLRIMGSSQGLLLICKTYLDRCPTEFLICNPATRSCALLPGLDKSLSYTSFGILFECHPRNLHPNDFPSDYTVIVPHIWKGAPCLSNQFLGFECGLTVYRHGKWDENTYELKIDGHLRTNMPVALFRGCNGGIVVHYLCQGRRQPERSDRPGRAIYEKPTLVTYDIDKKAYTRAFNLPEDSWKEGEDNVKMPRLTLKIFKWRSPAGETVGLVRTDERMFRVWMLEDYEQGRWRRVLAKTTAEIGLPEEESVMGCCVMNGTEMVFATERRVYMYEIEAGRLENVGEHGCEQEAPVAPPDVAFTMYANTLRPVSCGGSSVVNFDQHLRTCVLKHHKKTPKPHLSDKKL